MTKYFIPILFVFLSLSLSAQTESKNNKLLVSNVLRVKILAFNLNSNNKVRDMIPWYIKRDKDSISEKLILFQSEIEKSKDSIKYYIQPSLNEGGRHAIRFIYTNETPHSSIHIVFTKQDTLARIIQIDDWKLTKEVVEEYKSKSKDIWDIPPPPSPPLKHK